MTSFPVQLSNWHGTQQTLMMDCDDFFCHSVDLLAWLLADWNDFFPHSALLGHSDDLFISMVNSTSLSFRGNWSHLPTWVRLCAATARPTLPILTCACSIFPISKQMVSLPVLAIVSACTAVDACSCTLCMCLCTGAVRTPSERLH